MAIAVMQYLNLLGDLELEHEEAHHCMYLSIRFQHYTPCELFWLAISEHRMILSDHTCLGVHQSTTTYECTQ